MLRSLVGSEMCIRDRWNRADHIYFHPVSSSSFSSPNLSSRRLDVYHTSTRCGPSANIERRSENVLHAARWKYRTQKRHFGTIAQICWAISSELRHLSTIGKNLLDIDTSSTCPDNTVNFGLLTAEICVSFRHPCKFQRVSRLGSVTARHSSSGRQPAKLCGVEQRVPPTFGRVAITLDIGPHF